MSAKRIILGLAVFCTLWLGIARAEELAIVVPPAGLNAPFAQSLALAYQNNPKLKAAQAELKSTDELVSVARAGWQPTVTGSAGIATTHSSTADGTAENLELELSQPLYRGGQTLADVKEAKAKAMAGRAALVGAEQSVLLSAASAYVDVYRDQQILSLRQNNENVLAEQLAAAETRFKYGDVTKTDVSQAQARLASARADMIRAQGDLKSSRALFEQVIGQPPVEALDAPKIGLVLPSALNDAVKAAEQNNPTLTAAEYTTEAAVQALKSAQGALLPSVSFSASAEKTYNPVGSARDEISSSVLGVTASVPLYAAGVTQSNIKKARSIETQRRFEVEDARRGMVQSVVSAWEQYLAAVSEIGARDAQIEASAIAFEGVKAEQGVGSRTMLDVLNAEQELLDAKVARVVSEHGYVVAVFSLLEAMGSLTARHLGLNVALYDPGDSYQNVKRHPASPEKSKEEVLVPNK